MDANIIHSLSMHMLVYYYRSILQILPSLILYSLIEFTSLMCFWTGGGGGGQQGNLPQAPCVRGAPLPKIGLNLVHYAIFSSLLYNSKPLPTCVQSRETIYSCCFTFKFQINAHLLSRDHHTIVLLTICMHALKLHQMATACTSESLKSQNFLREHALRPP